MDFRDFPAFRELSGDQFRHFASICQYGTISADRSLIHQGLPGNRLFFILHGRVRVHLTTELGDRDLHELAGPTVLGEISFFSGEVSSASVTTVTDIEALVVPFNRLRARLYAGDAAASIVTLHLASAIAERASAMTHKLSDFYSHQTEVANTSNTLFGEWSFL